MKKFLGAFAAAAAILLAQGLVPHKSEPVGYKPEQPLPFNHKTHVATAGIKCLDCHSIREPGMLAGYPKETTCMGCHASVKADSPAIQKLAGFAKAKQAVPWAKVYKVPDYVWFSHASHHKDAGIACDACHGDVASMDVVSKEKPTNMAACMECHAKHKASNACDFCHNPN